MLITRGIYEGVIQGISELILDLRPTIERRRYKVTPSLIGWAQTCIVFVASLIFKNKNNWLQAKKKYRFNVLSATTPKPPPKSPFHVDITDGHGSIILLLEAPDFIFSNIFLNSTLNSNQWGLLYCLKFNYVNEISE